MILYIASSGHSGSSLLDYLLGSQSDTLSTGEMHRLSLEPSRRLCSCGAALACCPHWEEVRQHHSKRLQRPIESWSSFPISAQPSGRSELLGRQLATLAAATGRKLPAAIPFAAKIRNAADNTWKLHDSLCDALGVTAVVDSTKNPLRLHSLLRSRPESLFVVHLVRDGRAVAASAVRRTNVDIEKAARHWKYTQIKLGVITRQLPDNRVLRTRYEDLCAHPQGVVDDIRQKIGFSTTGPILRTRRVHHMIPGNPILHQGISEVRLDERWKRELTGAQLSSFEHVAGKANRRFGYH